MTDGCRIWLNQISTSYGTQPGKDFETQLDKLLNTETMIKVEPEKIVLSVSQLGGIGEKLIWEKEG
jgi:hypothetical protein